MKRVRILQQCSEVPLLTPPEPKSPVTGRRMLGTPSRPASQFLSNEVEVFARKVFVGGLPIDVTEDEIWQTFSVFGNVLVDWPRRPDGTSARDEESGRGSRSMTGYVFLVFEEESSVQYLVSECHKEDDRYYLFVSSPTMRDKPVQVRPWRLADMDFISNPRTLMDPRRTVFIGGVLRPTRASELAECLERLYGPVCYVGIDIDPELKYPKGAARVTFVTTQAFIAAINGRFVHVHHGESQKRVEIKPYVMDEQMCDHCEGKQCSSRYAPYFCGDVDCLQSDFSTIAKAAGIASTIVLDRDARNIVPSFVWETKPRSFLVHLITVTAQQETLADRLRRVTTVHRSAFRP
ncbi:hypothetical protein ANCCAN_22273 [Ancylostoma caninum]|uniref:RRM domain-containing protein n=1 Tax=Ancylostoma caninum TaxID=29170 RepID=A0A368FP28_ANCCA|nr:hypothetical protein ANCCAN_22273 [Ancylostoma caninum]